MSRLPHTEPPFPSATVMAQTPEHTACPWRERVTAREVEILDRLARGLLYREIGAELGIRTPTVKNHLHRIYAKIGVRSRTEAVVKWLRG